MLQGKKILFVIPRMGGGGAERVTALIANALSIQKNDVTIFTLVGGESFYHLNSAVKCNSVNISVNRKNQLTTYVSEAMAFPKSLLTIRKHIKKEKYDVVISMLVEADIIVGLCKLTGIKFEHVCSERNDPTKRSNRQLKLLNRIYKASSLFVCQSHMVSEFYKDVPNSKKMVISNPINPDGLPIRPKKLKKRVVAVGKLMDQKNFPLLIKSFSVVSRDFPEYTLTIYGEGEKRSQLEGLISKLGMKDKVFLPGASKEVQKDIADAELFVVSSDFEGFPNVLLEAIAIGIPAISTDFATGVARELVVEKKLLVPVNNEARMTEAMHYLLSNDELRSKIGAENKLRAKMYYTPNIIQQWDAALQKLC